MPTVKVQKSEWLMLGIAKFSVNGEDGINVEQMARELNCNKASFYWHFTSKEQFLTEMIGYWFESSIHPVLQTSTETTTANKRFEMFLRTSFQDNSRKDFMFFLRKLAVDKPPLQAILQDFTLKRLSFISMLLRDIGYSEADAKTKAEILLNFYVGWYEFNKYHNDSDTNHVESAIQLIKDFIKF